MLVDDAILMGGERDVQLSDGSVHRLEAVTIPSETKGLSMARMKCGRETHWWEPNKARPYHQLTCEDCQALVVEEELARPTMKEIADAVGEMMRSRTHPTAAPPVMNLNVPNTVVMKVPEEIAVNIGVDLAKEDDDAAADD